MGYGLASNKNNISALRYNNSCQEVTPEDPTAVVLFDTYKASSNKWLTVRWESYPVNCLYVILGILPREIGIKIGKSLDVKTRVEAFQDWSAQGLRKKNIWIGEYELSPTGVNGFEMYGRPLKSDMTAGSIAGDVFDTYFFDHKMNTDKQSIIIVSGLSAGSNIVRSCEGSCKARANISGKLIHFIETKGKDSLVSRRYAHCSYNDNGCAIPKSAFTGLTVNTGIGPIENMTGSSCGNRKSAKNECILVTRRMQEFAPWEDWNTIDNRVWK